MLFSTSSDEWIRPLECNGEKNYNITVMFVDGQERHQKNKKNKNKFPEKLKAPVLEAAEMWSRAIVRKKLDQYMMGSINQSFVGYWASVCGLPEGSIREIALDSLLLCVSYQNLGKSRAHIQAQAGPNIVDMTQLLPTVSSIQFNAGNEKYATNFDQSDWTNLAFHEIGHALGFAPYCYPFSKMITGYKNTFLNGTNVTREWKALGADSLPYPVISDDQAHWSSYCFFDEVMLSFIEEGKNHRGKDGRQPFSRLSLAVFEDIGYQVNYGCTDKIAISSTCVAKYHSSFKRCTVGKVAKLAFLGALGAFSFVCGRRSEELSI